MTDRSIYRLCLVTDKSLGLGRSLADVVRQAVDGGVTMVQLREKTASTRAFLDEAWSLKAVLDGTGVPLIINDRVDIALAVDAEGVHVGQSDMPVDMVRLLIGPGKLIGLSITDETQINRPDALAADYLGIGPVHLQSTKPDAAAPLGFDGFRRLRAMAGKPVLAIGGIKAKDAGDLALAGADGLAVVSAIMSAADPKTAAAELLRLP